MGQKRLLRDWGFAHWPTLGWRGGGITWKCLGSKPWGGFTSQPRAQPLAEQRRSRNRQLPSLAPDFPSIAKPGLALLFLGLSQGITLLSLFWEKEAFRSVRALVLSRARSSHTHVHSPENGEELIPEANLFCSNPAAVTGSPQVPRLRSCGGSHRFQAFSQCQLVTFPRVGRGGIAPSACLPRHRARGV